MTARPTAPWLSTCWGWSAAAAAPTTPRSPEASCGGSSKTQRLKQKQDQSSRSSPIPPHNTEKGGKGATWLLAQMKVTQPVNWIRFDGNTREPVQNPCLFQLTHSKKRRVSISAVLRNFILGATSVSKLSGLKDLVSAMCQELLQLQCEDLCSTRFLWKDSFYGKTHFNQIFVPGCVCSHHQMLLFF